MSAILSSIYATREVVTSTYRHAACAHVEQAPYVAVRTHTTIPQQPGLLELPRGADAVVVIYFGQVFPLYYNQAKPKRRSMLLAGQEVFKNLWVGAGREFFEVSRVGSSQPDPTRSDPTGLDQRVLIWPVYSRGANDSPVRCPC